MTPPTADADPPSALGPAKFRNADYCTDGAPRATVGLTRLETLWFNTGTLCNLACRHCYVESSPTNDRLVYLTLADVEPYLDEIERDGWQTAEIGLTGGEPFMAPEIVPILQAILARGFRALVLTNAMRPMMKLAVPLLNLKARFGARLVLRVSLDHYGRARHEVERGPRSWERAIAGLRWLAKNGFAVHIAGRTCWGESETQARAGYARLIAAEGWAVDALDPMQLVLFPEMDESVEVPEITAACWGVLDKSPGDVMCATSRMVVRRKGADRATVLACTLLPYDLAFEMGASLAEADAAVPLNHPHCAKFCVLGGGNCSKTV